MAAVTGRRRLAWTTAIAAAFVLFALVEFLASRG
jgi:hypothetical protein